MFFFDFEVSAYSCQEAVPSPAWNIFSKYVILLKPAVRCNCVSSQRSFEWLCGFWLFVKRHIRIHNIGGSKYLDMFWTERETWLCNIADFFVSVVSVTAGVGSVLRWSGHTGPDHFYPCAVARSAFEGGIAVVIKDVLLFK